MGTNGGWGVGVGWGQWKQLVRESKVNAITFSNKGVNLSVNNKFLSFDRVIIASGGTPNINGLDWLRVLGYQISLPIPSLFTFNMPKNSITDLMGVSVPNVIVSIMGSNLKQSGALLITHWGMSGPAILKLSAFAARHLAEQKYKFTAQINWLGINEEELRCHFVKLQECRKLIYNFNPFEIPKRLWFYIEELKNDKFFKKYVIWE